MAPRILVACLEVNLEYRNTLPVLVGLIAKQVRSVCALVRSRLKTTQQGDVFHDNASVHPLLCPYWRDISTQMLLSLSNQYIVGDDYTGLPQRLWCFYEFEDNGKRVIRANVIMVIRSSYSTDVYRFVWLVD